MTKAQWQELATYLYDLLDDVDTIGDIAKSNDKLYRTLVERKHRERFKVVAKNDGYCDFEFKPLSDDGVSFKKESMYENPPEMLRNIEPSPPLNPIDPQRIYW